MIGKTILFRALISAPVRLPFGGGVFFARLLFGLLIGLGLSAMAPTLLAGELKPIDTAPALAESYVPPPAGSYELQRIMSASDGRVLDIHGTPRKLSEFTGGKITLLSFIYTTCADPNGCPYAYMVFHRLQNQLAADPRLHGKVRLVSLSFDPKRDTPQMLRLYAGDNAKPGQPVEWDFLTTAGIPDLLPILDDFGQDVFLEVDPVTKAHLGTYSHVLKVFLIDSKYTVREVYTTVYLQAEMVYNDILTLLMEEGLK